MDIAVVPFLWIIPLTLYLLSFILAFETERFYNHRLFSMLNDSAVGVHIRHDVHWRRLLAWWFRSSSSSGNLFFLCMLCHGELVELKPNSRRSHIVLSHHLCRWAPGGLFVGLIASFIFTAIANFRWGFSARCSFMPERICGTIWVSENCPSLNVFDVWLWTIIILFLWFFFAAVNLVKGIERRSLCGCASKMTLKLELVAHPATWFMVELFMVGGFWMKLVVVSSQPTLTPPAWGEFSVRCLTSRSSVVVGLRCPNSGRVRSTRRPVSILKSIGV